MDTIEKLFEAVAEPETAAEEEAAENTVETMLGALNEKIDALISLITPAEDLEETEEEKTDEPEEEKKEEDEE